MKIIEIEKEQIPYEFEILLEDETYKFTVNYNSYGDFFTLDLAKNNKDIILGEKIVLGNVLFDRYKYLEIPRPLLFVTSQNLRDDRVTFENLGEDIFIFAISESDFNVD